MDLLEINWDEFEKNAAKNKAQKLIQCTSCGGTGAQCSFVSPEPMYGSITSIIKDPQQTCGTCNGTGFMQQS